VGKPIKKLGDNALMSHRETWNFFVGSDHVELCVMEKQQRPVPPPKDLLVLMGPMQRQAGIEPSDMVGVDYCLLMSGIEGNHIRYIPSASVVVLHLEIPPKKCSTERAIDGVRSTPFLITCPIGSTVVIEKLFPTFNIPQSHKP
jgi:hypothetical protein